MKIEKLLHGVRRNVLLKNYTTFRIGGPTKYLFVAETREDLLKAIKIVQKLNLPFFILGGGSNILVADKGYQGLVIRFQVSGFKFQENMLSTGAGTSLAALVFESVNHSLAGLEWAIGIPGTIGGAIYGNAGAFGKSMKNIVRKVEVLDREDLKFKIYDLRDCKFGYRDSVFKHKKNLIILSAEFQLKKIDKEKIKKRMKEFLDYRKRTQPLNFPSVGSIFKNYKSKIASHKLIKKYPGLKEFNKKREIPAGWLIEKCGLKGKKIGRAQISERHANFIVNLDGATAEDVKKLIKLIKQKVKSKFGITLEEEICYLGF